MRTITNTVNAYKFDELSQAAKDKAIEVYSRVSSENWSADYLIDDIKQTASEFGLDIDKLYYSGFYSQGDGASFTGSYKYKQGAYKAIKADRPNDHELQNIVKTLQDIEKRYFYKVSCTIIQRGHYYHENTIYIDSIRFDGEDSYNDNGKLEDELLECFRAYAQWAYSYLKDAYEWETGSEQCEEMIVNNEYEFTENGEMI